MSRDQARFDFERPAGEYPAGLYGGSLPASNDTTSRAAAESIKPLATRLAARVLEFIRDRSGSTCSEAEVGLGMAHQTASARIRELVQLGLVRDSGRRRPTPSGRNAIVWEVTVNP